MDVEDRDKWLEVGGGPEVVESVEIPESNPELDALLDEATKTKADEKAESSESKKSSEITDDQAAKWAFEGLSGLLAAVHQFTGREIEMPEKAAVLIVSLCCPAVKKYGAKVKLNPNGVDLDGWMPELMALGGVGTFGFIVDKQLKEKKVTGEVDHGDQREHG